MFVMQCSNTNTHESHVFGKHWKKVDLPNLLHPELLPREWDSYYQCPGIQIEAFSVEYLHRDCTPCEACADMAVDRAKNNQSTREVWREMGPHETITHMAEVNRV